VVSPSIRLWCCGAIEERKEGGREGGREGAMTAAPPVVLIIAIV